MNLGKICALLAAIMISACGQPDVEVPPTDEIEILPSESTSLPTQINVDPTSPAIGTLTIYSAQAIITMDKEQSTSTAIAVEMGRILGLGNVDDLQHAYPNAVIDESFKDQVIVPGLIDPHVHMILGAMMYALPAIPPWDMPTPTGQIAGVQGKEAFLARLKALEAEVASGNAPYIVYGYHNLIHGDIDKHDLDSITTGRPLIVWHYSGHDFYLNSNAIKTARITPDMADQFEGLPLGEDGQPTGRVYEDAVPVLLNSIGPYLLNLKNISTGFKGFEKMLAEAGVTAVAELGYGIFGRQLEDQFYTFLYKDDGPYKLYLVPEHRAFVREFEGEAVKEISKRAATKASPQVLSQVKFFTDAAFYSQTMRLSAPGYTGGQSAGSHGLWVTEQEALTKAMRPYWQAGLDLRIHSNGDAAQDATLAAMAILRAETPAPDQIFTLEHAGLMRPMHVAALSAQKGGVSAASHYVYYMGHQYEEAIGERIKYITPLASVTASGAPVTLHSDAPLAPPEPLRAASVHMTRATREGGVSTPAEALSAYEALEAITLDAAWAMGLEDEIGSLVVGKRADFTVLGQNPLETPAPEWPQIEIWGVVRDGTKYPLD